MNTTAADEVIEPRERPGYGPFLLVAFVALVVCTNIANIVFASLPNDEVLRGKAIVGLGEERHEDVAERRRRRVEDRDPELGCVGGVGEERVQAV